MDIEEEFFPEITGDNELPMYCAEWLALQEEYARLKTVEAKIKGYKAGIENRIKKHGFEEAEKVRVGDYVLYIQRVAEKEERKITQYDVGHPMPGTKRKAYMKILINTEPKQ